MQKFTAIATMWEPSDSLCEWVQRASALKSSWKPQPT